MKIPSGTADFITRMFSDLQVWVERMSGRRSCGLPVESGDSRQSATERPVLASGRQGDRRPNGTPQTLRSSPAVPSRAAGRLWCEVSSSDLPNRRHDDRTDKRVVLPRT
jgi:hypothetical protein